MVGIILGAITFLVANHFYHGIQDPLDEPVETENENESAAEVKPGPAAGVGPVRR